MMEPLAAVAFSNSSSSGRRLSTADTFLDTAAAVPTTLFSTLSYEDFVERRLQVLWGLHVYGFAIGFFLCAFTSFFCALRLRGQFYPQHRLLLYTCALLIIIGLSRTVFLLLDAYGVMGRLPLPLLGLLHSLTYPALTAALAMSVFAMASFSLRKSPSRYVYALLFMHHVLCGVLAVLEGLPANQQQFRNNRLHPHFNADFGNNNFYYRSGNNILWDFLSASSSSASSQQNQSKMNGVDVEEFLRKPPLAPLQRIRVTQPWRVNKSPPSPDTASLSSSAAATVATATFISNSTSNNSTTITILTKEEVDDGGGIAQIANKQDIDAASSATINRFVLERRELLLHSRKKRVLLHQQMPPTATRQTVTERRNSSQQQQQQLEVTQAAERLTNYYISVHVSIVILRILTTFSTGISIWLIYVFSCFRAEIYGMVRASQKQARAAQLIKKLEPAGRPLAAQRLYNRIFPRRDDTAATTAANNSSTTMAALSGMLVLSGNFTASATNVPAAFLENNSGNSKKSHRKHREHSTNSTPTTSSSGNATSSTAGAVMRAKLALLTPIRKKSSASSNLSKLVVLQQSKTNAQKSISSAASSSSTAAASTSKTQLQKTHSSAVSQQQLQQKNSPQKQYSITTTSLSIASPETTTASASGATTHETTQTSSSTSASGLASTAAATATSNGMQLTGATGQHHNENSNRQSTASPAAAAVAAIVSTSASVPNFTNAVNTVSSNTDASVSLVPACNNETTGEDNTPNSNRREHSPSTTQMSGSKSANVITATTELDQSADIVVFSAVDQHKYRNNDNMYIKSQSPYVSLHTLEDWAVDSSSVGDATSPLFMAAATAALKQHQRRPLVKVVTRRGGKRRSSDEDIGDDEDDDYYGDEQCVMITTTNVTAAHRSPMQQTAAMTPPPPPVRQHQPLELKLDSKKNELPVAAAAPQTAASGKPTRQFIGRPSVAFADPLPPGLGHHLSTKAAAAIALLTVVSPPASGSSISLPDGKTTDGHAPPLADWMRRPSQRLLSISTAGVLAVDAEAAAAAAAAGRRPTQQGAFLRDVFNRRFSTRTGDGSSGSGVSELTSFIRYHYYVIVTHIIVSVLYIYSIYALPFDIGHVSDLNYLEQWYTFTSVTRFMELLQCTVIGYLIVNKPTLLELLPVKPRKSIY